MHLKYQPIPITIFYLFRYFLILEISIRTVSDCVLGDVDFSGIFSHEESIPGANRDGTKVSGGGGGGIRDAMYSL